MPEIEVTSGPYVVSGDVPLRRRRIVSTEQGEPLTWETTGVLDTGGEEYALCRCGGSSNKPFCDGTHAERDWDGTETAPTDSYDDRAEVLGGTGVTVRDDRSICEHAGFCATKATNVWKMAQDDTDTATRSQMVAMVERCPSGALTYRTDAAADVGADLATEISVVDDGPLMVTGGVPVTRADGEAFESRPRMTLCRCGASSLKPLCDGSHAEAGFADS